MRVKIKIQPRGSNQCGQYCLSMLTNVKPETIMGTKVGKGATSTAQLVSFIRSFQFVCARKLKRINKLTNLPKLCILNYRYKGRSMGHWVLYYNGTVYDPAMGKYLYSKEEIQQHFNCTITSYLEIK